MNIVFAQPAAFLRSSAKTNPYFDPIIKCTGGDWSIWMPKGENSGYPAERVRYYGALVFWSTWFWRVVHVLCPWLPSWKVYYAFGRLARPFLREWTNADIIITITGLFSDVLAGAFPNIRIVDIQHGVIYSKHSGYFNKDGSLIEAYRHFTNREFWLYGQGYADCFFKSPENHKWLEGRVKVIGDVVRAGRKVEVGGGQRNMVIFSLQLTDDLDNEEKRKSVEATERFFADFFAKFGDKYDCYIKHHPRYNDCFDLSAFYAKFLQVKETKESWSDLYPKMALHVTFNSTVSFDCASAGVPTCLPSFEGAKVLDNRFYQDDYNYPYYGKTAEEMLMMPFEEISKTVHDWYLRFYTPFSEEACLKLLRGE